MTHREQLPDEFKQGLTFRRCIVCGKPSSHKIVVEMRDDVGLVGQTTFPVCERHRDDVVEAEREAYELGDTSEEEE